VTPPTLPAALGTPLTLPVAYALDWLVGDPPRPTHPVVLMGRAAEALEGWVYGRAARRGLLRAAGVAVVLAVAVGAFAAGRAVLELAQRIHPLLRAALEAWLLQTCLAARSLRDAARTVEGHLEAGNLEEARAALPALVGRDTDGLPPPEVRRAVVESVAENTVDGVLSPLFFAALGGAPAALAFKAVSTLDSMFGYRDARYALFGWAAARADDAANWLPARLGGVMMVAAAALLGLDGRGAWRVWRRDARRHPSPNAGIPEACFAGALGLRLGGWDRHGGEPRYRPHLGDGRPADARAVREALRLAAWTSHLGAAAAVAAAWGMAWWRR
jgi:adenosylcobinamide-phosphate synthase